MEITNDSGRAIAGEGKVAVATTAKEGDVIRVADSDRSAAERLLGEHLTAGRLTSEEYGERAAQAMSARVRAEIVALFRDLPAPHPRFDQADQVTAAGPRQPGSQPVSRSPRPARHLRHAAIAVTAPCAIFGAGMGLAFATKTPILLLLAAFVVAVTYGGVTVVDHYRHRRRGDR